MNKVFNTPFENALRVLLLLSADAQNAKTADMLSAVDFITIYGNSLGLSDYNLHGENPFSFSELTIRRGLIASAIKQLVTKGLVSARKCQDGFCYQITASGQAVAQTLDSDYADEYLIAARAALAFASGKTERELFSFINKHAALSLNKGGQNG